MLTGPVLDQAPPSRLPDIAAAQPRFLAAVRIAVPGMLLALVCLLPYLNKAYTNDDPWFLFQARQILKTPLQPTAYSICWEADGTCLDKASHSGRLWFSQSLMGYLLVPAVLIQHGEWLTHLLQMLLACVAVLEMVRLALRLGFNSIQATVAGLMLVAIPPLLPMASTAMPDVAALMLGLTGIERLVSWKEERRWHQVAIAGLALGLAPFARPHLGLLLPLGALWLFDGYQLRKALRQFRREAYLWAPILMGGAILVAANVLTHDWDPATGPVGAQTGNEHIPRNLYSYLMYFAYPIPFAAIWVATRWRKAPMLLILPLIPVLIMHFMLSPSASLLAEWPAAAAAYGLATLGYMLFQYMRARDRVGLLLSLWVLIPLPVVIYHQFPIKYMLAVMPAIILILIRNL